MLIATMTSTHVVRSSCSFQNVCSWILEGERYFKLGCLFWDERRCIFVSAFALFFYIYFCFALTNLPWSHSIEWFVGSATDGYIEWLKTYHVYQLNNKSWGYILPLEVAESTVVWGSMWCLVPVSLLCPWMIRIQSLTTKPSTFVTEKNPCPRERRSIQSGQHDR